MGRRGGSHPRPGLPRVNLLSQSDLDRIAVRRLRTRFVAGGVALALLVGAGWFVQHQRVNDAKKLVTVEKAETDRLSGEAKELTDIKTFVAGVDGQKQTVAATMGQEIYFSRVLSGIRGASPIGTTLQSIAVTLAADAAGSSAAAGDAGASVCPGPDPFQTEAVVGCVTLSGTAVSRAEVGELVTRLGSMGLFVEPFISTTTTGDAQTVAFSGSVGLSEKVYSHRYGTVPAAQTSDTPESGTSDDGADQASAATGGES
ncbi:hypothetical protein ASC77_19300 [Nocardioides sp. Root1257]|nr:hypothetical protein ASC77_19300 [Nocardioides sp. Root1257]KRC43307.1 hypothetical protein ASE24_20265 [Nocardioides sp. Root224]